MPSIRIGRHHSRATAAAALLLLVGLTVGWPTGAARARARDSAAKSDQAPASTRPKQRLPNHYAQLGLSNRQERKILELRAEYAEKIAVLELEIAELQARRELETEALLTDEQKAELKRLRQAAEAKKKLEDSNGANRKGRP